VARKPRKMHPFRHWMDDRGLSYAQVLLMLRGMGYETPRSYLSAKLCGHRPIDWDLSKYLSRVTEGALSAEQIMDYFRREENAA
jgi:hypothetical protein